MSAKGDAGGAGDLAPHEEQPTKDSFDALLRQAARVSLPRPAQVRVLPAGSTLVDGRLSVLRKLGEGGMGVVYEAFDAHRKQRVALKTLNRLDASSVYRLKNEFRALANVTHEHLVQLHELFADGELWFFAMELCDGQRFDRWVRPGGALDEARLRAALPQLVSAIGAIHDAGKLHRDLKPSNVLVTSDGCVKVLDFGLAVDPELGAVGHTVADDSVSGTPAYMAPEQAAGGEVTAACDFYALGVMLFEALTGELPFSGRAHEMLVDKQRRDAPRASAVCASAPADLDAVCAQLLSREPSARPAAAALREHFPGHERTTQDTAMRSATGGRHPSAGDVGDAVPPAPELFGREPELAALHDALSTTLGGRSVVMFVSGESGMGKSALCEGFALAMRAQGRATVLSGRCYERESVPFKGFDALVDDISRHLRRLSREDAALLLPREIYALARIFPVLDRIAVVAEAPKKTIPDPQELKRRAFQAFGELLGRMRDRAPLIVVLDDTQWLDRDSVHFLRALFVHPEPVPALLLCAHRTEGAQANALLQSVKQGARDNPKFDARELRVGPLPEQALRMLTQRLLPGDADVRAVDALTTEAQGSPFFAATLARAAVLRGLDGLTPSLADALSWQVESLPLAARRLLQLLALAGQPLSTEVAIEAAGVDDGHRSLDRLRSEQLVRVSLDVGGGRAVECYHDKIREQLAAALDPLQVRELALGLARALEARQDADAELLSRVLQMAGLPVEAARHAARAADRALSALAFDRAAQLYAQALEHGRFDGAELQALRVGLAEALAQAGRPEQAAEAYVAAAEHAAEADAHELQRIAGQQFLMGGDLARGRALLDKALRRVGHALPQSMPMALASIAWSRARLRVRGFSFTARESPPPAVLRELELLRVTVHALVRSDPVRAFDFSARFARRAFDAGVADEAARALAWEVMLRGIAGAPEEELDPLRQLSGQLAERSRVPIAAAWVSYCRGVGDVFGGTRQERALADLDAFLAWLAAAPGGTSVSDRAWAQYFRASALWNLGRAAEAGELACAQLEDAVARGEHTVAACLLNEVCAFLKVCGRIEQAERLLEEGRVRLRPGEVTWADPQWLCARISIGLYAGRPLETWRQTAELRDRFFGSLAGRAFASQVLNNASGLAAAAMRETSDPGERRALERAARSMSRRLVSASVGPTTACPAALIACLDGDRDVAVAALRARLTAQAGPLTDNAVRRRLGELLGGDEGCALVAEADAALRRCGVVDPVRYTASMAPGIELS